MQAAKVTPQKATSALKSHLKYLQYRERNPERESKSDRAFFNAKQDQIDRRAVAKAVMQGERAGGIYYHRMVLSPAANEPVGDLKAWTRAILSDLSQRLGTDVNWYAMQHRNTENPHVHVVIQGTGQERSTGRAVPVAFNPQDFKFLRDKGREHSEYELQRFLDDLRERDTVSQEQEPRQGRNEQDTYTDIGR